MLLLLNRLVSQAPADNADVPYWWSGIASHCTNSIEVKSAGVVRLLKNGSAIG